MDFNPTPFNFVSGFNSWLQLVGIIGAIALGLGLLGSFLYGGGANGLPVFLKGLVSFFKEIVTVSPGRIWALTALTVKECVRRKALLVFVVFAVLLMFGGWFLPESAERAELEVSNHIAFVLTTISWLILPVVIFLSCWGIPEDIRLRSLHTVVTKPARRVEVVLGRMFGYGTMAITILILMGAVGYVWIQRQVPDDMKGINGGTNLLTCRVPVYGDFFYFLDREGLPSRTGLNVGDAWKFRSFVEGNTRSRAVWIFNDIFPETIGESLRLESRFEAFRTIKGSEQSMTSGLEAQYTLLQDTREEAFSSFGVGASFREAGEALREGNFQNASQLLSTVAERMSSAPLDFSPIDCRQVAIASVQESAYVLRKIEKGFEDVAKAFEEFGFAASEVIDPEDEASRGKMSIACATLADVLNERGDDLREAMPRIEVPLEPFEVHEFHEGDAYETYPRELTYTANNESTARFLTRTITDLNDLDKVVTGSELSADLLSDLEAANIETVNAELVIEVLQAEIEAGKLLAADGKLAVADNGRFLQVFDRLVREERLISQDPAGWVLKADLFKDLAPHGALRIQVACLDDQMYLGMARSDMFIRLKDNSFFVGYSKALLNIGLMLCLVIVLGVTASCIVKGPVSFFFTLTMFVIGQFFHSFMTRILMGQEKGSGMIESAMMIVQHRSPSTGIDTSERSMQMIQAADKVNLGLLHAASNIIPDFSNFTSAAIYIENGFDVPWASSVLPAIATFVGFLVPCVIISAACLKFRELEAK